MEPTSQQHETRFTPVSLEALRRSLSLFAEEREWEKFHTPRNLVLALVGEVGELAEIFQWRGEVAAGLPNFSQAEVVHVGQELSDVLLYLLRLADVCGVDLGRAALQKLADNAAKYPAAHCRGKADKYTAYSREEHAHSQQQQQAQQQQVHQQIQQHHRQQRQQQQQQQQHTHHTYVQQAGGNAGITAASAAEAAAAAAGLPMTADGAQPNGVHQQYAEAAVAAENQAQHAAAPPLRGGTKHAKHHHHQQQHQQLLQQQPQLVPAAVPAAAEQAAPAPANTAPPQQLQGQLSLRVLRQLAALSSTNPTAAVELLASNPSATSSLVAAISDPANPAAAMCVQFLSGSGLGAVLAAGGGAAAVPAAAAAQLDRHSQQWSGGAGAESSGGHHQQQQQHQQQVKGAAAAQHGRQEQRAAAGTAGVHPAAAAAAAAASSGQGPGRLAPTPVTAITRAQAVHNSLAVVAQAPEAAAAAADAGTVDDAAGQQAAAGVAQLSELQQQAIMQLEAATNRQLGPHEQAAVAAALGVDLAALQAFLAGQHQTASKALKRSRPDAAAAAAEMAAEGGNGGGGSAGGAASAGSGSDDAGEPARSRQRTSSSGGAAGALAGVQPACGHEPVTAAAVAPTAAGTAHNTDEHAGTNAPALSQQQQQQQQDAVGACEDGGRAASPGDAPQPQAGAAALAAGASRHGCNRALDAAGGTAATAVASEGATT